jgi:glycosidase
LPVNSSLISRFTLVAGLLIGHAATPIFAGPVPGVESFTRKPVDFPVPPSTEVWDIGNDEYLVTFKWTPTEPVSKPGVAGAFNSWSRSDLPFSGPDAKGVWSVTARIKGGEYRYKFISGDDGWFPDPLNEIRDEDGHGGHNTILRLGLVALLSGREAKVGDNQIEARALRHEPAETTYFDLFSPNDVVIRTRSLVGDVASVAIEWVNRDGSTTPHTMEHVASDQLYDFWEIHHRAHKGDTAVGYRFVYTDGDATVKPPTVHPLVMDRTRIISTPEWARDAVWYQIMVDRFRDGDPSNNPEATAETERVKHTHPWATEWYTEQPYEREDGKTFWRWSMYDRLYGGDFAGVEKELDYIKSLGVTAIYFNPIFEATNSHKYNARSYRHADDGYGKAGEFARSVALEDTLDPETWIFNESDKKLLKLIKAAKKRNMRVIFDGVFNHVGSDAIYFQDVKKKGRASRFADWFDVVSWEPFKYTGWAGFDGLPQFRKDTEHGLASESLRKYIYDITTRWMDPNGDGDPSDGIDGWRLDVPMDVPMAFWRGWCAHVRSINPDAYIVGEIWDPAEEWLNGQTFDAVMNYQFAKIAFRYFGNDKEKLSASEFDRELARLRVRYPRAHTEVLQNLFDSHDTDRWVSRLANPDMPYDGRNRIQDDGTEYFDKRPTAAHYQKLKLMALLQSSYIGAPMIWYGTEVGMFGADDPRCRMPMWWADLMPYETPDYTIDLDLKATFQKLFALRHGSDDLRRGDFKTVIKDDAADVFGFVRWDTDGKKATVVVLNNSAETRAITLESPDTSILPRGYRQGRVLFALPAADGTLPTLTQTRASRTAAVDLNLPPVTGIVFTVSR